MGNVVLDCDWPEMRRAEHNDRLSHPVSCQQRVRAFL